MLLWAVKVEMGVSNCERESLECTLKYPERMTEWVEEEEKKKKKRKKEQYIWESSIAGCYLSLWDGTMS